MKYPHMALGLVVALLTSQALPAHADPAPSTGNSNNLEVRVGVMNPSGNNIQTSATFSAGVEYDFMNTKSGGGTLSLSADYVQVNYFVPVFSNGFIFAGNASQATVPVLVNYKFYGSGNDSRFFGGVGAGAWLGGYNGLAYTGFVGYQFSKNLDLSARYIGDAGSSSVNGSTLNNAWGASVGFRF